MIDVTTAKEHIRKTVSKLNAIKLPLHKSLGLVLAEDILSPINMPPFDQSAMDGYALKFHDALDYKVVAEIQAGSTLNPTMQAGQAIRIFTGAAVPSNADAVIMQEKTTRSGDFIRIEAQPALGTNIRPKAEQIEQNSLALVKRSLLSPAAIGFLAGLGVQEVSVTRQPNISVITTGNELVKAGQDLERGQIYESNAIMLTMAIEDCGFSVAKNLHIRDNYAETLALLETEIAQQDFVFITGGISVGDYDFVGKALAELEVEQIFYKIKQKPGKPIYMGKKGNCIIFALPGNPASALTCFYQYGLMSLKIATGHPKVELAKAFLPLAETYHKKGARAHFLKAEASFDSVQYLNSQSSAMLISFAAANALIYIPEDKMVVEKGELVEVHYLP